jgi:hypothetical protein
VCTSVDCQQLKHQLFGDKMTSNQNVTQRNDLVTSHRGQLSDTPVDKDVGYQTAKLAHSGQSNVARAKKSTLLWVHK